MNGMSLPQLIRGSVTFGADPELFIVRDREGKKPRVVGSERIITQPILATAPGNDKCGTVTTDGVQVELHPSTSTCRQSFSYYLQHCLLALEREVKKHPGLRISFDSMVRVPEKEFVGLSDHARLLGCSPSMNFYGRPKVEVNGLEYRYRSAAGHLHLGSSELVNGKITPDRLIPCLDLLVGIPSVLIDKDPAQAERRKNYGRAGEYRIQPHGIEYRTLGNFWLKSYHLMAFVCAQARVAYALAWGEANKTTYVKGGGYVIDGVNQLLEAVREEGGMKVVEGVINENDYKGALSIYENVIKPTMKTWSNYDGLFTVNPSSGTLDGAWDDFEFFISRPLSEWVNPNPIEEWRRRPETGWESWLSGEVRRRRKTAIKQVAVGAF